MKIPEYGVQQRCLDLRCITKKGGKLSKSEMKFIETMNNKYPEWYKSTEQWVFEATKPFGSQC